MTAIPARDGLCELVEKYLNEQILGNEPWWYEFSPVVILDPAGNLIPGYMVILSTRSGLLQPPRIAINDVIWDAHPSEEQIRTSVQGCIDKLLQMRARVTDSSKMSPGGLALP